MKRSTLVWIMIALFAVVGVGLAQTNLLLTNAPVALPGTNAFGNPGSVVSIPLSAVPTWLQLLVMPLTLALVAGVKKWLPSMNSNYLPFIVPFVGAGINVLSDLLGAWGNQGLISSAVAGAALGGLSTWLHQIGKQGNEIKQANSATPSTPNSNA